MPCPEVGCGAAISNPECELLLAASPSDIEMYHQVRFAGAQQESCCWEDAADQQPVESLQHTAQSCVAFAFTIMAGNLFHVPGIGCAACDVPALACLQVEAEASIPDECKFYCPNSCCSALMAFEGEALPDSPQFCPACSHKICTYCRVVWHKGFGCAEYQVGLHDCARCVR